MVVSQFLDGSLYQHRILDQKEERTLLEEMVAERDRGQSDGPARTKLVLHNLRLAVHHAKKYQGRGINLDDLVSEAVLGLLRAADLFNVGRTNRFSTYATYWVTQYLQRAIAYQGRTVRLPDHVHQAIRKLYKLNVRHQHRHGRLLKRHEIIRCLRCTGAKADELVKVFNQRITSLNLPLGDQQESVGSLYVDPQSQRPEERAILKEKSERLKAALLKLPSRYQQVLRLRFGLDGPPLTLQQIANRKDFRLSKERVRQIELEGLRKLRRLLLKPALVEA